jgi:preprotein translocase SecF subunit
MLATGGLLTAIALLTLAAVAPVFRSSNPPRWTTYGWVGELVTLAIVCTLALGLGYLGAGAIEAFQTGPNYLDLGLLAVVLFVSVVIWRRLSARVRPKAVEADAGLYATVAILIYIWFRFEWQFAIGAIVALVHDAVTTLGLFSLFGLEFNLTSVAAVLTIIGYSTNDTVVIYDRVRENLRRYKAMPLPELIDRSINETLARTVMTSLTTLLVLIALVAVGGPVIRDFTIAMIWGVLVGTYSTIYVASPMVLHLNLRREPATQAAEAAE